MEAAILWVITVGFSVCLVAALFSCVCGCRKAEPKNELLGLAGNVKITNPDDTLSRNGQWPPGGAVLDADVGPATADVADTNANKRCSTSANRSLPDLPVEPGRLRSAEEAVLWEGQEGGGDTGSELYATVEDSARQGSSQHHLKKATASSSLISERKDQVTPSFSRESLSTREARDASTVNASDDDSFSTYARLKKEHPYDKLYKSEHPYAQVRPPGSRDGSRDNNQTPSSNGDSSEANDPIPPPRVRKSNSHGSLTPPLIPSAAGGQGAGGQASPTLSRESVVGIEAAPAIAGRVSASQDLPYMTPPIPNSQFGQHFSGDSQDSSKGYTSISVREPLANIQRTKLADQQDSHYTTVSDDSDEMYAAIEDPSQVYTSGSETYAQIQPLVVAVPALATVVPSETTDCEDQGARSTSPQPGLSAQPAHPVHPTPQPHPAPQPPSVDSLKHVAQAHSRQASSSSATSSVANLGSPKPDKRAANSPLPPPPPPNLPSPEGGCSLEEMYAKVIKKKRGSNDEPDRRSQDTDSNGSHPSSPQRRYSTPQPAPVLLDSQEVANCARLSKMSDPGYESVSVSAHTAHVGISANTIDRDPGYETVKRNHNLSDGDPNYEELRVRSEDSKQSEIDGYQQIHVRSDDYEPKYARLTREQPRTSKTEPINEPDYASISREKKCAKPAKKSVVRTDCETDDPGYERVAGSGNDPGYEQVKSRKGRSENYHDQDSPDYESVRARHVDEESTSDPGYERVRVAGSKLSNLNHSDPNYESLQNEEPNYESVRYFSPNNIAVKEASNHVSNDSHHSVNML